MAVRLIDGNELFGIIKLLDTDIVRNSKTASWLLDQVLHDIRQMPTLTPTNEPLTCDGCYWQTHGSFGQCFGCFREKTDNYRRPPEGEEDA